MAVPLPQSAYFVTEHGPALHTSPSLPSPTPQVVLVHMAPPAPQPPMYQVNYVSASYSALDPALAPAQAGQRYQDQLFAQCAVGNHEIRTTYGIVGVLCAIFFFPIGLICLFSDVENKCVRCGAQV